MIGLTGMLVLELDGMTMAVIALSLFWIHVLLISGAGVMDLVELGRLRRRVLAARAGEVRSARGPGGLLARNWVEQLGRLDRRGGPRQIHFHDRAQHSEVFGGQVALAEGGELELVPASAGQAAVWPELGERAKRAGQVDAERFGQAAVAAGKAKGFERIVETRIVVGDRVWVIDGEPASRMILADHDPRAWLARSIGLVLALVIGNVLVAGLCTLLALASPHFGWVSMIGAAGALGWFLAVQPLGVAVHDAVRSPDSAFLRGRWQDG